MVYSYYMAIVSFSDSITKVFYETGRLSKKAKWRGARKVVLRKLDMLSFAFVLNDLRSPPNNRLEALKGNLKGFYSIRVNDQWRLIFKWSPQGPFDVAVVDYH